MKKVFFVCMLLALWSCSGNKNNNVDRESTNVPESASDSLRQDGALLSSQVDSLEKQIGLLSDSLTLRTETSDSLQNEIVRLRSQVKRLRSASRANSERDTESEELQEENSRLLRQSDSLKAKIAADAKRLESLQNELNKSLDRIKKLEVKLDSMATAKANTRHPFYMEGNRVGELSSEEGRRFTTYTVDISKNDLRFFWQDDSKRPYGNFSTYDRDIKSKGEELVFATNGGMYLSDQSPQGLYIEQGELHKKADMAKKGYGNFYIQPNGIFLVTKAGRPQVITTGDWKKFNKKDIQYATQSGPMLLIDGKVSDKLMKNSKNFHIRSGVGVIDENRVVFIISNEVVRFYELAMAFKELGCDNALYLDGAISQMYLPEANRNDPGGSYGVMIGVARKK